MVDHPLTHGDIYEAPRVRLVSGGDHVRVNWIAVGALAFCAATWYGVAALIGTVL